MHDLDLDLARTIGRAAKPLQVEVIRELRAEDLCLLELERGIKPTPIKKLRDSHHAVARCIAEGKKDTETQLITGLSANRISILKNDPSFKELVSFYAGKVDEIRGKDFVDFNTKMLAVGTNSADEILDRLDDTPEEFTRDELANLMKIAADRTGHGPQTKTTSLNFNIDLAQRVSAGRARVERLSAPSPPDTKALPTPVEGEALVGRTPESSPLPIEGEVVDGD